MLISLLNFFVSFTVAQTTTSPSCLRLEGILLPICTLPTADTCHSGQLELCTYIREIRNYIRPITDSTPGDCPVPLVPNPGCGPNPENCTLDPICPEPKPNIHTCRNRCDNCYDPQNPTIDLQVQCAKFCGDEEPRCPGSVIGSDGNLWRKKPPQVNVCNTTEQSCQQLGCNPGSSCYGSQGANACGPNDTCRPPEGPASVNDCPQIPPPPPPSPFDVNACCYNGAGASPYPGLRKCGECQVGPNSLNCTPPAP